MSAARETCPHCGGVADPTTTCPKAVGCPRCGANPGTRCKRPSGHPASELHAARVELAESQPPRADLQLTIDGRTEQIAPPREEPSKPEQGGLFDAAGFPSVAGQLSMGQGATDNRKEGME